MAFVTNTFTTYDAKGLREDLSDIIYNISPTETPFVTSIGRTKATGTLHEWQTDALAAADGNNAQLEGDDVSSYDVAPPTVRIGNYCQISRKTCIVSGTNQVVDKAGRSDEMGYQMAKRGKEIKRDIEKICLQNQARAAGSTSVARKAASVLSWLKTNTDKDAGGSDPAAADGTGVRTDSGTTRLITEPLLQGVLQKIFDNSGDEPELCLVGSSQKIKISAFSGNQTRYVQASEEELVNSIDVYTGDFSTVKIVPDRFMRQRDCLILNTNLWKISWLRPLNQTPLGKTGDNEKRLLLGEWTLESNNEAGSGGIFDLT